MVPFSSSGSSFHKYASHEDLGYVVKYIICIIAMATSLGTSEWKGGVHISHLKDWKQFINRITSIDECDFMLFVNNLWYSMFFRVAIRVLKFQDMIQPGVIPTTENRMWLRHMQSLGYKLVVVSVWELCPPLPDLNPPGSWFFFFLI